MGREGGGVSVLFSLINLKMVLLSFLLHYLLSQVKSCVLDLKSHSCTGFSHVGVSRAATRCRPCIGQIRSERAAARRGEDGPPRVWPFETATKLRSGNPGRPFPLHGLSWH